MQHGGKFRNYLSVSGLQKQPLTACLRAGCQHRLPAVQASATSLPAMHLAAHQPVWGVWSTVRLSLFLLCLKPVITGHQLPVRHLQSGKLSTDLS